MSDDQEHLEAIERASGQLESITEERDQLVKLSQWQWARIGACFRKAKALLDDDDYAAFRNLVDADPCGGIKADPRLPWNGATGEGRKP